MEEFLHHHINWWSPDFWSINVVSHSKKTGKNSLGTAPEDRNECEKLKYRERRKTLARQKRLERPPLSAEELAAASQGGGGW